MLDVLLKSGYSVPLGPARFLSKSDYQRLTEGVSKTNGKTLGPPSCPQRHPPAFRDSRG